MQLTCSGFLTQRFLRTIGDQQLLAFLKEELNYENETMKNLEKPKMDVFNQPVSQLQHVIASYFIVIEICSMEVKVIITGFNITSVS